MTGESGTEGENGITGLGGSGGDGGDGGDGGRGGGGGSGGPGGQGGGGAGGTVLFKAPILLAAGGTINATGGSAFSPGGNGRYLVAQNGGVAPDAGTISGASREDFFNQGSSGVNPFIESNATTTSNVIGLVGGADVYGLKAGISNNDSYFDDVRNNAPAGAVVAVLRRSDGPSAGEKYFMRDLLLLVNLTDSPLTGPMLGVGAAGSDFEAPLFEQGFARNPQFGGAGPTTLGALPAGGVYATLVDNGLGLEVNASISGSPGVQGLSFDTLDVAYILASLELDGDYNGNGVVDAADYTVWRDSLGQGGDDLDADGNLDDTVNEADYTFWKERFGQAAPASGSATIIGVPEPSSVVLAAACALLAYGASLRRRAGV
ncbi:MAG: hypothetical protein WD851_10975 [Pirellulales bacterium]